MTTGDGSFSIGSEVWPGLSKLIEECGELLQVAGKLMATHGSPEHWDGDLIPRLVEEIGDVQGAIGFFIFVNPEIDRGQVMERAIAKHRLFEKWHEEGDPPPTRYEVVPVEEDRV